MTGSATSPSWSRGRAGENLLHEIEVLGKPFVRLYPCERQQAFFDGLSRGFLYYGGVFPVMVFDNLTAAEKSFSEKARKEQESFVRFRSWYT